jgi:hypothetical protein
MLGICVATIKAQERYMKALKKLALTTTCLSVLGVMFSGGYNSLVMSNDAFMEIDSGVKFVKRLDEVNGEVTIGRMAASAPVKSFAFETPVKKIEVKKEVAQEVIKKAAPRVAQVQKEVVVEPAIRGDLDLSLSSVFHKKPLDKGTFSGSAKTVDGVIEEIYVNLPGGDQIEINTRERMAGNVFQYEDSVTREMKSGMLYEVKKGTYMVTLTNDSKFAGTRLEFSSNNAQVAYSDSYYQNNQNWGADEQNYDSQIANEAVSNNPNVGTQDEYANEKTETNYGFNFKS